MSQKVRMGVIGLGAMGTLHAKYIQSGAINRCELAAVFDLNKERMKEFPDARHFLDSGELMRSVEVDAVLIATPHYFHTDIGVEALNNGLHVLVEKPISVHKADCERLIAAHKDEKLVFGAMFNLRTVPLYKKIKQLIDDGELGEVTRMSWIITDWFRTEAYYASSEWRGTWKGEGGGVLLNQCPHQLDLLQWFLGMPTKVRGFCGFGVKHNIEVEDQVTAYFEFKNGATGVFIASTGECPGTNRLEIAGERGKLMLEGGKLRFIRNEVPMTEFSRTTEEPLGRPGTWNIDLPIPEGGGRHEELTQNFVDAILDGTPLIAPAENGMNSVELANSVLYSTLTNSTIDMPLDGQAFAKSLENLIKDSRFEKKVKEINFDPTVSFSKA